MIKLLTILKSILKESRESDAMLERPEFLRNFLNSVVDGKYGESNITYQDVFSFMNQAERDMTVGDYELLDKLSELYQVIRSLPNEGTFQELEDLVKNQF